MLSIANISLPRSINHIGIVVKDLDAAIKSLSSVWRPGPWQFLELNETMNTLVPCEPFKNMVGQTTLGSLVVEINQPIEGRSIWSDFLRTHGEGLHHLGYSIDNYEKMLSMIEEQGIEVIAGGVFYGTRWFAFQIESTGIVMEYEDIASQP